MSEILDFEGVDMKEGEEKWPVEVLVGVGEAGQLVVLDRDSNKLILSERLPSPAAATGGRGRGKLAVEPPGR